MMGGIWFQNLILLDHLFLANEIVELSVPELEMWEYVRLKITFYMMDG